MTQAKFLNETILYKRLKTLYEKCSKSDSTECEKVINLVDKITVDATNTLETISNQFKDFTLHNEVHSINIINRIGNIIEVSESLEELSFIEIGILILSAYLHDIGMAYDENFFHKIIGTKDFKSFYEMETGKIFDLSKFKEDIKNISHDNETNNEQEIFNNYSRLYHGKLSRTYIINKWEKDEDWTINNVSIVDIVADICESHALDMIKIENSDKFDQQKLLENDPINILYLAILLRLGDILDFDKRRTPIDIYQNISPENEISIEQWEKHLTVDGWEITKGDIIFDCCCTNPNIQAVLYDFLDKIDYELDTCLNVVKRFSDENKEKYKLKLPHKVNRNKIRSKGFEFKDIKFQLDHDKIIKLLMGTELWGNSSLFIRELIQNSYDAIKYREVVDHKNNEKWTNGKITITQRINDTGNLEIIFKDNGIGMDEDILENYFFKVGNSYYQSEIFEKEKNSFKIAGKTFDPISYFGIGIMSSFLIGNSLKIITQKYYSPYKVGEKINVNVTSMSNRIFMKILNDSPDPGTEITIIGKKLTEEEIFEDPVDLYDAVKHYVRALDIPIEINVEPPFNCINKTIDPITHPLLLKTTMEKEIPKEYIETFEINLSEIHNDIEGTLRKSFLKDKNGKITIKNEYAEFIIIKDDIDPELEFIRLLNKNTNSEIDLSSTREVFCQDGILIMHFNNNENYKSRKYGEEETFIYEGSLFVNLKKDKKLPLKIDRSHYDYYERNNPQEIKWNDFYEEIASLEVKILEKIVTDENLCPSAENFWKLFMTSNYQIEDLPKEILYEHIPFHFIINNKIQFKTLADLNLEGIKHISLNSSINSGSILPNIIFDNELLSEYDYELWDLYNLKNKFYNILSLFTKLKIEDGIVKYEISKELSSFKNTKEIIFDSVDNIHYQTYEKKLNEYILVHDQINGVNFSHPAIKFVLNNKKGKYHLFIKGMIKFIKLINQEEIYGQDYNKWLITDIEYLKEIVYYWNAFDWNLLEKEIRPPYKILLPNENVELLITLKYLNDILNDLNETPEITDYI